MDNTPPESNDAFTAKYLIKDANSPEPREVTRDEFIRLQASVGLYPNGEGELAQSKFLTMGLGGKLSGIMVTTCNELEAALKELRRR